jgi:hypothetical protein
LIYEQRKLFAQALREFQLAAEHSEGNGLVLAALAHLYASAGSTSDARTILHSLEQDNTIFVSDWALALAYIGLREPEKALASLARCLTARSLQAAIFLSTEPRLDSLRADPRFHELETAMYAGVLMT